jgi:hypothetical protein
MRNTIKTVVVATSALGLSTLVALPANAMSIKKDDNCVTVITPTVQYSGGNPWISDPEVHVYNCVTVETD